MMKKLNQRDILIGYKIKQLRISNGYTQNKLANLLEITTQHYGTLERGVNTISLDSILKICEFYKIPVYSILGEINNTDKRRKREREKLIIQIDSLNNEHKSTIRHMVKFYTQLENKEQKIMKELEETRRMGKLYKEDTKNEADEQEANQDKVAKNKKTRSKASKNKVNKNKNKDKKDKTIKSKTTKKNAKKRNTTKAKNSKTKAKTKSKSKAKAVKEPENDNNK